MSSFLISQINLAEKRKLCTFATQINKDKIKHNMGKKFAEHSKLNLSDVNKEVLEQWKGEDLFHRSITEREGCPSFVFFEGPPSANGHPGIHHVMGRTVSKI